MRAMLLTTPVPQGEPLSPVELAEPAPGPSQLLLRVKACAICRTDLQLVSGDLAARRLPIIPGHQAVGLVEDVGAAVVGWSVGERAGVGWLGSTCGVCAYCSSGRENLCEAASFTGWDQDGGYAEKMLVDAAYALHLPASFSDLDAAPLLCGGVIGFRALRRSGIRPGERLGLFGYGASASLAIQVARHWGCEVYVCTRSGAEQRRAKAAGAAWAGGYEDALPAVLDAAVTFAPAGSVVVEALKAVKPGGVVAINAIHLDRMPEFSYDLLWRERELRSVANFTRDDAQDFLKLAAAIPIRTAIQTFSLGAANEALRQLEAGSLQATAVLLPN